MILHRFADYPEQPWKNGQGVTREIARTDLPAGGGFLWRLSLADVGRSGPFSPFEGYDRTITLLEGDGFALEFADGARRELTTPGEPFDFDGGAPLHCTLLGGLSRDLNLMVRRDHAGATWRILKGQGPHGIAAGDDAVTAIVFCLTGSARLSGADGTEHMLGRWDTGILEPGDAISVNAGAETDIFAATLVLR